MDLKIILQYNKNKNFVNVLETVLENVENKVTFSQHVTVFTDENVPLKIYDGASNESVLYTDLLHHFMYSPRSIGMAERKKNIYDKLILSTIPNISSKFLKEAENTLEKLIDLDNNKVPIWSKGCSYKKASLSFGPNSRNSVITWIKLFINSLRDTKMRTYR